MSRADLVELAQVAHKSGDAEASRTVHDAKKRTAPEVHGGAGSDYIKSIVFGGIDGIITTFSTIASIVGGSMPIEVVLTLGFANLIADGISMGLGDYLSSKAEYQHLVAEKAREKWELDNYPEGERAEMIDELVKRGLEQEDASTIVTTMAKKPDFFVDFMMTEELGLEIPDDPWGPLKEGVVTFLSFLVFGCVPMWVYLILWGAKYEDHAGIFGIASAATALTLFSLGALQGRITKLSTWRAGLQMLINGSLASASAYVVGWGIMKAVGSSC